MPHTATRIFVDGNFNPPKGITLPWDVRAVLKRGTTDVGQLYGDVDRHGNRVNKINKWAKYKPVRHAKKGVLTEAERQGVHYGLSIQSFTYLGSPGSPTTFLGKLVAGQLAWEYLPPRGEAYNEPFRPLDFDGYYGDSICPVGDVSPVSVFTSGEGIIAWELPELDPDNISLDDIAINDTPLSDFYLGVLLYQSDSRYRIVTSDEVFGEGDVQISLSNIPPDDMGTWRVYPFFSSVPIAYGGSTGAGVYVSAGWTTHEELTFRDSSSYFSLDIFAVWNPAYTQILYEIYATNGLSAQVVLEDVTVHLRKNQDGSTPPLSGDDLVQSTLGTITIPAASGGEPYIYHLDGLTLDYNASDHETYTYWIGASATGRAAVFMPIEEYEPPEE